MNVPVDAASGIGEGLTPSADRSSAEHGSTPSYLIEEPDLLWGGHASHE